MRGLVFLTALALAACGDSGGLGSGDVGTDLGPPDAVQDVAPDLGPQDTPQPDIAPDLGPDLGPDIAPDLPPDLGPDIGPEVTPDVSPDLGPDVPLDDPTGSPHAGLVVFNELLIDADTDTLLDPNGDGDLDPTDDELVELVSLSPAPLDLAGWTLVDQDFPATPRHTFAPGTTLAPGHALVVFGGGEAPEDTPGATFVVADNTDTGFAWGLHLTDEGNTLRLLDADGLEVATIAWGTAGGEALPEDQSLTRAPDGHGPWSPHTEAAPDGALFSPGARVDGEPFPIELQ